MKNEHSYSLAEHERHWQRYGVHRASRQAALPAMSSGWPALDRLLPGGGYPIGAVTELLVATNGIGETSLLLHGLAAQMAAFAQHRLALVAPPDALNAPALIQAGIDCARAPIVHCRDDSERIWCVEQMAAPGVFTALIVWGDTLDGTALRRLQLAAEKAACPIFVYRDIRRASERSPAALRLAVSSRVTQGLSQQQLEVVKCRGPAGARLSGLCLDHDRPWSLPSKSIVVLGEDRSASNDFNPVEREPLIYSYAVAPEPLRAAGKEGGVLRARCTQTTDDAVQTCAKARPRRGLAQKALSWRCRS